MTRRGKYDAYDFPGLFDEAESRLSYEDAAHGELIEKVRLTGGQPSVSSPDVSDRKSVV